jgi:hypothetical protein
MAVRRGLRVDVERQGPAYGNFDAASEFRAK